MDSTTTDGGKSISSNLEIRTPLILGCYYFYDTILYCNHPCVNLNLVPCVFLLLGDSLCYCLVETGDRSLQLAHFSSCAQYFVLVLAHREYVVGWFWPKLDFKVSTQVKRQVNDLSTTH